MRWKRVRDKLLKPSVILNTYLVEELYAHRARSSCVPRKPFRPFDGEGFRIGLAALLDWPADRQDKLEDLISIVFGQLEAMALERVLFAPGEIDPAEFVRGLATVKRASS